MQIISGGQTGVDRAALDVALDLGLPCGGWCPRGRRAEDGPIPAHYPLRETESADYAVRTEANVKEADGTLILTRGKLDRGTALTVKLARKHLKPYIIVDFALLEDTASVASWLEEWQIRILNVAGPRESSQPGIYQQASDYLQELLDPFSRPVDS